MTSPARNEPGPVPALPASSQAEAARYALLRRLAPSMRHHLVVNLQPIGMIYEVMDRRLRAAAPDLPEIQDGAHKINGFARAALGACLDMVTWLAPEEGAVTTVGEGVRESLGMLATSLTFRGFAVRNEVVPAPGEVRRSAVRNVLTAALIHVTDENSPPGELVLTMEPDRSALVLALTLRPTDGDKGFAAEPQYRAIQWDDVQALAAAESVTLSRTGRQQMRLSIPWAGST